MASTGPEIWFYHLERWSLDRALPPLLEKTLQRGWRAVVQVGVPERIDALDAHLWTYRDDGFLPHALADDEHVSEQPIVLTEAQENPNGAEALFLVDSAQPGDLTGYQRCILIFDGNDQDSLKEAREHWKSFKDNGS
jgi:DNA polymerase-3 subunit chi